MKKSILFLSLVLSFNSYSNRESGGISSQRPMNLSAVFLNFFSPGNGIDTESYKKAKSIIDFSKNAELIEEVTESSWGREGERVVCVEFKEVHMAYGLIKTLAPRIAKDRRTSVSLALNCSNIENSIPQDVQDYLMTTITDSNEAIFKALDITAVNRNPGIAGSFRLEKRVGGLKCTLSRLVVRDAKDEYNCFLEKEYIGKEIYDALDVEGIVTRPMALGDTITTEKKVGNLTCLHSVSFISTRPESYKCTLVKPAISIEL